MQEAGNTELNDSISELSQLISHDQKDLYSLIMRSEVQTYFSTQGIDFLI